MHHNIIRRCLSGGLYGVLPICLLVLGCSSSATKKSTSGAAPSTPPSGKAVQEDATSTLEATQDAQYNELKGTWKVDGCSKIDTGSAQQGKIVAKAHMITTIDSFSDLNCATLKERFFITTTYQTGALVGSSPWRKIDYAVTGFSAAFNDPLVIKQMNAAKVCGFTDWAAGVAKDVTNNTCTSSTPLVIALFKSPKDFNIYQIVGGKLISGKEDADHDGLSDARRPIALSDAATGLTKQAKDDDMLNHLDILLAGQGITAAAAESADALRPLKITIPSLPATDTAALTHLEVVLSPANPFKQTQIFQAQAINSVTSPAVSPDTYTITVLQVDQTGTTTKASGSATVVISSAANQAVTIPIK